MQIISSEAHKHRSLAVAAQKRVKPLSRDREGVIWPCGMGEPGSPGQAKAYPTWGMLQLACRANSPACPCGPPKTMKLDPAVFFNGGGQPVSESPHEANSPYITELTYFPRRKLPTSMASMPEE